MSKPYKVYNTYNEFMMDIREMNPFELYGEDVIESIKKNVGLETAIALLASNEIEAGVIINKLLDYGLISASDVISVLVNKGIKIDLDFVCDKKIIVKVEECNKKEEVNEYNGNKEEEVTKEENVKEENIKKESKNEDKEEDEFSVFDDDEE